MEKRRKRYHQQIRIRSTPFEQTESQSPTTIPAKFGSIWFHRRLKCKKLTSDDKSSVASK